MTLCVDYYVLKMSECKVVDLIQEETALKVFNS